MFISIKDIRNLCENRIKMLKTQGYVTEGYDEELAKLADSYDTLIAFAKKLNRPLLREDFPYREPNDLETIRKQRQENREDSSSSYINEMEIKDKTYGGVFGRMIGCILGKPLEVPISPGELKNYLVGAGSWPLNDFVPTYSPNQVMPLRRDCVESMKGFVKFVQEDDDINFMILALKVLERFGVNFTTRDMAWLWCENIPYRWTWGPEHSRYYLLAGQWVYDQNKTLEDLNWDDMAAFLNDGDELIGAMIRGDAFGLVNPGRMEIAAEMAWRDGRLTHGKTGLYAEMWVAATLAAAYHVSDPVKAIQAGIDQLPQNTRYTECLKEALQWSIEEKDWLKVFDRILEKWGYLGHAGTFNESAAIINALVHSVDSLGNIDFEQVVCRTVMQGWDTDCSGATAGCIAGVLAGYRNIPDKWLKPLNNTFYSCVATEREHNISNFAERMYQMSRVVRAGR